MKTISKPTLKELLEDDKEAYRYYLKKIKTEYMAYLPLHLHILLGHVRKIKQYIAAGYDLNTPDIWGRTAVYYAIFNEDIKILKLLVDSGADYRFVDRKVSNCTLVHLAAAEGYLDKVKYLIETLGLGFSDVNNDNQTPLSASMIFQQVEVAEYLIALGAVNDYQITRIDVLLIHLTNVLKKLNKQAQKMAVVPFEILDKIRKITNFIASV